MNDDCPIALGRDLCSYFLNSDQSRWSRNINHSEKRDDRFLLNFLHARIAFGITWAPKTNAYRRSGEYVRTHTYYMCNGICAPSVARSRKSREIRGDFNGDFYPLSMLRVFGCANSLAPQVLWKYVSGQWRSLLHRNPASANLSEKAFPRSSKFTQDIESRGLCTRVHNTLVRREEPLEG